MYFESFSDFLAMGGHAKYVWIAYGIALVVFAFNILAPIIKRKRLMAEQARQLRREELHASGS
ncbi:MAG: heme exporter protein CcmD [Pseudomonadales bacterium]|jgi:heme exporter protein D